MLASAELSSISVCVVLKASVEQPVGARRDDPENTLVGITSRTKLEIVVTVEELRGIRYRAGKVEGLSQVNGIRGVPPDDCS